MRGSGTVSYRTSCLPCQHRARIVTSGAHSRPLFRACRTQGNTRWGPAFRSVNFKEIAGCERNGSAADARTKAGRHPWRRLLEHHLGATLFDRLPRGLSLTLAGESHLPIVAESFERLSRGTQSLFGESGRERLTLRSAAGFARFWLLPRLPAFVLARPEVTVRLASSTWGFEPFEADIDLEIRFGVGPWPGFRAERLSWDEVFP